MTPLRFGYSDSLHVLPLLYPFTAGWVAPPGLDVTWQALPSGELLAALDAGGLDAALVPPVGYARRRQALALLPGVGLASEGATAAAVLHSAVRPDLLDGQAIRLPGPPTDDPAAALLAVLLRPYFSIHAHLLPPNAPVPDGGALGGTVLAGDAAVAARRLWLLHEAYLRAIPAPDAPTKSKRLASVPAPDPASAGYATDLGAAWWVLTGVSLVWTVGVVRQQLATDQPDLIPNLVAGFAAARRTATEQAPTVLAAAAERGQVPEAVVTALFAVQTPALGPREYGALDAFYSYTARLGLTPR